MVASDGGSVRVNAGADLVTFPGPGTDVEFAMSAVVPAVVVDVVEYSSRPTNSSSTGSSTTSS